MNAAGTAGNAILNAAGVTTQGNINADMTAFNAAVGGNQIRMGGIFQHESWKSQDRQALASGLFQAGSTAMSGSAGSGMSSPNKSSSAQTSWRAPSSSESSSGMYGPILKN
jgi:hypothetical protein